MTLKSIGAPALSGPGLDRLFAMLQPTRFTNKSTLFDTGYEQAKADVREKLIAEIGRPHDDIVTVEAAADYEVGQVYPAAAPKARRFFLW